MMAQTWQPVEDGEYLNGTTMLSVCYGGMELEQWSTINVYKDGSPKDVEEITLGELRLCRLVPTEASASVPSEVAQTIREALERAKNDTDMFMGGPTLGELKQIDDALAWLDAQRP